MTLRTAYLSLGSNLGDRASNLRRALWRLQDHRLQVQNLSSLYESAPIGPITDQPPFYNAVAQIQTTLEPLSLLKRCLWVEAELGRERVIDKGPRKIDLDLLLIDQLVLQEPELVIPHPEMIKRAFVLAPLLEIEPMMSDPRSGTLFCQYLGPLLQRQSLIRLGTLQQLPNSTLDALFSRKALPRRLLVI